MEQAAKYNLFMDRWHGRTDVYGRQWISDPDENGKVRRGYSPACGNFFKAGCHIKLKDGIPCSSCEIKAYSPVTSDTVALHISGEQPQIHYVLQEDGTCYFAAVDFDMKPGREISGHRFEDVARFCAVLKEWGLPYGIARSTGDGFHVYVFFSEPVEAKKIRSLFMEIFRIVGFMEEHMNAIRPLPELFPKQSSAIGGVGNGIRPPMCEPNFERGRNCFVDDSNQVIAEQWEYLASIPKVPSTKLDQIIADKSIEIMESIGVAKGLRARTTGAPRVWQQPTSGSFGKVLESCKAFRVLREKCEKGEHIGHHEGMALWIAAINTADGEKFFREGHVPGWGVTDADWKQLDQAKHAGYSPFTCTKMQEHGICVRGTKCFDRKPPVERVAGQLVVMDTLPESEWPSPSPIRYAFSAGEDYLNKLLGELDGLVAETDEEKRLARLGVIVKRSMVFDQEQQGKVKAKIEELKLAKRRELNKRFKEAQTEKDREFKENSAARSDVIAVNDLRIRKLQPAGYSLMKSGKGDHEGERIFSTLDVDIEEERTIIKDEKDRNTILSGKIKLYNGRTYPFEIELNKWADSTEMYRTLMQACGTEFTVAPQDLHLLRVAAMEYNRPARRKPVFYDTQGWYQDSYLMPSVIVDKDGVVPNTDKKVDLSRKEHPRFLDFRILSDTEFKDALFHIKTDLLGTFQRGPTMLGLGHTMMAGIFRYLGFRFKPTLWLEGLSGTGKSQLSILLSKFWGDFKGGLIWKTTAISMIDYAYQFRDALLVVDDYKEDPRVQVAARETVQYSYDEYSARGAMNRNGEQRGDRTSRCFFMMSGEDVPVNEASVIGRLTLIKYDKHDTSQTTESYNRCLQMSEYYRGITPRFIHWILNQDRARLQKDTHDTQVELRKPIIGRINDARISQNIGIALNGWKWFVMFMEESGALTRQESESLINEAYGAAEEARDDMVERCTGEQNGVVFRRRLVELLQSGELKIRHLDGFDRPDSSGHYIGFVDRTVDDPIAYLWPHQTIEMVRSNIKGHFTISSQAASSQLHDMGIIMKEDRRTFQTVKWFENTNHRTWKVDLVKLGLLTNRLKMIKNETLKLEQPPVNADGSV